MEKIELAAADGARAEVYRHGAHVTSWRPVSGEERLFLSTRSLFAPGKAIRGGIPVIFPQFASLGSLPKHGFARVCEWEMVRAGRTSTGKGEAQFRLTSTPDTRVLWPNDFDAMLVVTAGGMSLSVAFSVVNRDAADFTFTAALHTYLLVENVREVAIAGLEGVAYRDAAAGNFEGRQRDRELCATGELDRIYFDVPGSIEVRDRVRNTGLSMSGFPDAVIWNPGATLAATLADLEPDGWRRMLCVEAAVIGKPLMLRPGERWTGQQTITAR